MPEFAKTADPLAPQQPSLSPEQAMQVQNNRTLQTDATNDIIRTAILSLAGGAALRGGYGLWNNWKRDAAKEDDQPDVMPLPYPLVERKRKPVLKVAAQTPAAPATPGIFDNAAATDKTELGYYPIGLLAAALGGGYAGWKGTGMMLDWRRRKEREAELSDAQKQFHTALLSQYSDKMGLGKTAADDEVVKAGQAIDRLYESFSAAYTKQAKPDPGMLQQTASWMDSLFSPATLRKSLAFYYPYAGVSALIAGTAMYDKARKANQQAMLDKAVRKRDIRRYAQQPSELFAVPEPVPVKAAG